MYKIICVFVFGGGICVIGQIMMDVFKLTPAHTTCTLVVVGTILGSLGIYDRLIEIGGAGASVQISNFGNSLAKAAIKGGEENGIIGIFSNIFREASSGICAAIIFAFIAALIFKPKG